VQPGDGSLADASGVPAVDMTVERKQVPCTELYAFVHMGMVQVAAHGRRIVMIAGKRQYRSLQRSQLCIKALVAGNGFVVRQAASTRQPCSTAAASARRCRSLIWTILRVCLMMMQLPNDATAEG